MCCNNGAIPVRSLTFQVEHDKIIARFGFRVFEENVVHGCTLRFHVHSQSSNARSVHVIIKPKADRLRRNPVQRRDEASSLDKHLSVGVYHHVMSLERNPGGVVGMRTRRHRNGFIVVSAAPLEVKVVVGVVCPAADALSCVSWKKARESRGKSIKFYFR